MKKIPDQSYPIPDEILTATIEALRNYTLRLEAEAVMLAGLKSPEAEKLAQERLEAEAVMLAGLKSPEAEKLAQERLEDAEVAEKLFHYFLSL